MKRILFLLPIISSLVSFGQAYEDKVEYNKKKEPVFAMEYNYPPDIVEGAFIQKLEKMGFKAKQEKGMFNSDKGFRNYKNTVITEITTTSMDYIVKIERKSRKDKDEAVVYLMMNKDGSNMMDILDAEVKEKAKTFLKELTPDIEAYDLEVKIKDQEEVLSKAEKKQTKLEDDLNDMEKKKKKLEEEIEQNKKDQEKQKEEISNQQKALELLRGKQKKN